MCVPQGRALSQNDWPEVTWKLIPSPSNPRQQATWQGSPPVFPQPLLSAQEPLPIKPPALSAHVSPWTIHFWVSDKSPLSGLEGVSLPATASPEKFAQFFRSWVFLRVCFCFCFFNVDHCFLSLYWVCYNIASFLCFLVFLAARHVRS